MTKTKIEIFSDGSAQSEGKPGGYGWVLVVDGVKVDQGSDHMVSASNNDAELLGAIQGLIATMRYCVKNFIIEAGAPFPHQHFDITLVSDSKLVLGWASGEYRFKQLDKLDKFHTLKKLVDTMQVNTRWVKGHTGDPMNSLCDKLANAARLKLSNKIEIEEKKAKGETLIGRRKTGVICLYYKDQLKIIDLKAGLIENYSRDLHGPRGGILEVREEKSR